MIPSRRRLPLPLHGNPGDPRTDDITGDVVTRGKLRPRWGLHAIDADLAIGNLVEPVRQQAKAWRRAGPGAKPPAAPR